MKKIRIRKGGPGSGNFGHSGRPGEVGGSAPSNLDSGELTDVLNRWLVSPSRVSSTEKAALASIAKREKTSRASLERVYRDDPELTVGEVVELPLTSFTGVKVSEGLFGGQIGWKSSDACLGLILNPTRGFDLPYEELHSLVAGVSLEKETLVAGKYRVVDIRKVVEPGTDPNYGYKVKQYVFEEIE